MNKFAATPAAKPIANCLIGPTETRTAEPTPPTTRETSRHARRAAQESTRAPLETAGR